MIEERKRRRRTDKGTNRGRECNLINGKREIVIEGGGEKERI